MCLFFSIFDLFICSFIYLFIGFFICQVVGISVKLQLQEILQFLEKQFKDQFNFINCPPNNSIFGENLGYFVINFKNTEKIYRFTKDFLDRKLFPYESDDDDCRTRRTVQFCTLQRVACDTDKDLDSLCREKERLAGVVSDFRVNRRSGMSKVKSDERERVEESVATEVEKGDGKEEEKEKEKGRGKRKEERKRLRWKKGMIMKIIKGEMCQL